MRLHMEVTHTQSHMINAWSEMVSTPCLALYCPCSPWLIQRIWDNSSPIMDQHCRLITTLLLLVLHFYDYEQPNAPPSTIFSNASNTLTQKNVCKIGIQEHYERLESSNQRTLTTSRVSIRTPNLELQNPTYVCI